MDATSAPLDVSFESVVLGAITIVATILTRRIYGPDKLLFLPMTVSDHATRGPAKAVFLACLSTLAAYRWFHLHNHAPVASSLEVIGWLCVGCFPVQRRRDDQGNWTWGVGRRPTLYNALHEVGFTIALGLAVNSLTYNNVSGAPVCRKPGYHAYLVTCIAAVLLFLAGIGYNWRERSDDSFRIMGGAQWICFTMVILPKLAGWV